MTGRVPPKFRQKTGSFRGGPERDPAPGRKYTALHYPALVSVPEDSNNRGPMKHLSLSISLILSLVALVLTGCGKQSQTAQKDPAGPAPVIVSVEQKVSYGVGYNMGAGLARDGTLTVDQGALMAGIRDGLAKAKPRLPDAELEAAFVTMREKMSAAQAEAGKKQLAAGNEYLAKNKVRPGVTVTASGLQDEVLKSGTGPKPKPAGTAKVHYH